ncbi:MAG: hypothetical protein HKN07_05230 [Acidimicrobiia bacterium]|nr:hypothetical protein [Acidimicrobiia bacterium]
MLLIWGFKARYKTLESGTFFCPHDGGDRTYVKREVRRWFTLFFIPLIPLKVLGEFIECTSCRRSYDLVVLTTPTAAHVMDNLANAVRLAVVTIVTADGRVDDDEKRAALEVASRYSDTHYEMADLDRDLTELAGGDLSAALAGVAGSLNPDGKELLLVACVEIAGADGSVDPSEVAAIERAGAALGLSAAHVRGVVAEVVDRLPNS